MSRPKPPTKSLGVRMDPELFARLSKAAEERDVSVNWLMCKGIAYYLDRLVPADEMRWTIDD